MTWMINPLRTSCWAQSESLRTFSTWPTGFLNHLMRELQGCVIGARRRRWRGGRRIHPMDSVYQQFQLNKVRIEMEVGDSNSKHKETRKYHRVKPCLRSRNKDFKIIVMLHHLRNKRTWKRAARLQFKLQVDSKSVINQGLLKGQALTQIISRVVRFSPKVQVSGTSTLN